MDGTVEILPLWRNALANFIATDPKPGDVIKRTWLMEQFGIEKPITAEEQQSAQLQFLHDFLEFKEALLEEHKMELRSIIGVGFEVIHPREQTRFALERGTKAIGKEIRKMAKSVAHVNTAALSEAELRERTDGLAKISGMQAIFSRRKFLGRS